MGGSGFPAGRAPFARGGRACESASSTTAKKLESSGMSARRRHCSPFEEISSSRVTLRSTIHFWSMVSSRKAQTFPLACLSRHSLAGAAREPAGAASSVMGRRSCASSGRRGTVTASAFFMRRKTWPHWAQVTATPDSGTRSSSTRYFALQRSQRTSIRVVAQGSLAPHLDASTGFEPKN